MVVFKSHSDSYDILKEGDLTNEELAAAVAEIVEGCTRKGGRVLCAGHDILSYTVALTRKGYRTEGLDFSQTGSGQGGQGTRHGNDDSIDNITEIKQDIAAYDERTFDCIVSVDALRQGEITISDYSRILRPSGRLFIFESCDAVGGHSITGRVYTEGEIRKENEGSGLRTERVSYYNTTGSHLLVSAVKPRYYFEMNRFKFMSADTKDDLAKVSKLKYQAYCIELGVEPENDSGLLQDVYDEHSLQLLALDEKSRPVGTMRVVPNNPKGFPMERDFALNEYMNASNISKAVEVTRFVIPSEIEVDDRTTISFGLFTCLYAFCVETKTNDMFATTQPKIAKKYNFAGFKQIGEAFQYMKPVPGVLWVPMHCNIRETYEQFMDRSRSSSELP
ncbi:GNAT family N-acyltransferase [Chloroflexota bacterium]